MIRCSLGTAKVLGLKSVRIDALPTTAYFMIGKRCKYNCSFCAQARESEARADMLSRISWPEFNGENVMTSLASDGVQKDLQRICFQVVQDQAALEETKKWVKKVKIHCDTPICVSAGPKTLDEITELLSLGIDHVSIALDAATPDIFARIKDGSWEKRYSLLCSAAEKYPGHIATHLIAGLGESEEDMVLRFQDMTDRGITIALFAFTPVRGTAMEHVTAPDISTYRHLQAALYLIRTGKARADQFVFRQGQLVDFGIPFTELHDHLKNGEVYRTSGCQGCNRPYYNETPGRELYNFPKALSPKEVEKAWEQTIIGINRSST